MNVGQAAHLSRQMSGQAAQMNQVGGSSGGVGTSAGADGLLQHQMQDGVGLGTGIHPQFVMLRNNMRQKIFEYIGRKQSSADWRRRRLLVLARRLEEILFRKFPNKNEYYHMMKQPFEPQLQFAIKTLGAQNRQAQDEAALLAKEKEAAQANDYSIKRCISVLKIMDVTRDEKVKASEVFMIPDYRETFISFNEDDPETALLWLRGKMDKL